MTLVEGRNPVALRLAAGQERELELTLLAQRWGGHVIGPTFVRARDPLGLLTWETTAETRPELRTYPREAVLQRVIQAADTQVFAGNEVARTKGEGIEFADIRPWGAGDALKRVNWRASARRGDLWVNESHPERNTDVILFVDSFAEARLGGEGTLDLAARATSALADAYVRRRDRVGLIAFGGILRWLVPGTGLVQLYRIVDSLLDTQIVLSYYWKEIDVIPRRTLPPNALVLALSPLLDPRSVGALIDLRARGHDLAVIDVSPVPFTKRPASGLDSIAYDIWTLRRDALRHRLRSTGRRGRRVGQRAAPAGRPGGGEGIQALRPARARLITALGALLTLGAHVRLRSRDRRPVRADRDRRRRAWPSGCSRSGLVLRWPSMIPWTIILAAAGVSDRPRGEGPGRRLGSRRGRGCSCSRPSSHRGRSSTTRGSAPSRRSRFAAP